MRTMPTRSPGFLLAAALWVAPSAGFLLGQAAEPAAPAAPSAETEARKWREDLRFMASEMPKRHRNLFHTMTREQFEQAVQSLDARIPSLARHQIIVEMARIAAMVGDGHTNVAPTRDPKIAFRAYPLRLYLFDDGLAVRAASREHAAAVGARVVRIGKATAEEAYRAARDLIGRDNEMGAKFFAPHLLVMPEILHALGLVADMEDAAFTLSKGGRTWVERFSPAGPADLMSPDTDASWLAKPGFVDARDAAERPRPRWLQSPQNKYWFEYLPEARTVYVQFNQVGNKDDESIEAFAGAALRLRGRQPGGPPGPGPASEPRRQRRAQPPDPGGPDPGAEGESKRTALHDHRTRHLVRGPVPGQRARALHRDDLRRRADRRKGQQLRGLPADHAPQQRHHRPRLDALVAGRRAGQAPVDRPPDRRGPDPRGLPNQRGSGAPGRARLLSRTQLWPSS